MARRPTVNTRCVAHAYAGPSERIVEVTFPSGLGCLIQLQELEPGRALIGVYRADDGIAVLGPIKEA